MDIYVKDLFVKFIKSQCDLIFVYQFFVWIFLYVYVLLLCSTAHFLPHDCSITTSIITFISLAYSLDKFRAIIFKFIIVYIRVLVTSFVDINSHTRSSPKQNISGFALDFVVETAMVFILRSFLIRIP